VLKNTGIGRLLNKKTSISFPKKLLKKVLGIPDMNLDHVPAIRMHLDSTNLIFVVKPYGQFAVQILVMNADNHDHKQSFWNFRQKHLISRGYAPPEPDLRSQPETSTLQSGCTEETRSVIATTNVTTNTRVGDPSLIDPQQRYALWESFGAGMGRSVARNPQEETSSREITEAGTAGAGSISIDCISQSTGASATDSSLTPVRK